LASPHEMQRFESCRPSQPVRLQRVRKRVALEMPRREAKKFKRKPRRIIGIFGKDIASGGRTPSLSIPVILRINFFGCGRRRRA
jgi:hypothetical protein